MNFDVDVFDARARIAGMLLTTFPAVSDRVLRFVSPRVAGLIVKAIDLLSNSNVRIAGFEIPVAGYTITSHHGENGMTVTITEVPQAVSYGVIGALRAQNFKLRDATVDSKNRTLRFKYAGRVQHTA